MAEPWRSESALGRGTTAILGLPSRAVGLDEIWEGAGGDGLAP